MTRSAARRYGGWAALAGIVSAGVLLAVAEALALLVDRAASPILAAGSFVIDVVPQPLKEFAIGAFGVYDKLVLLLGLGLAVGVAAALAGVLQYARPPAGLLVVAVASGLATAATVTRAGATPLSALPAAAGAVAALLLLRALVARLRRWSGRAPEAAVGPGGRRSAARAPGPAAPGAVDRRGFFRISILAGAGALLVGAGARIANAALSSLDGVRRALALPAPGTTVEVPAGAELDIEGLSPLYRPNADFYRVDTALTVPTVDPETWRLAVTGMVDEPVELGFRDLIGMGLDEYSLTLTCVSNEVGGGLVGTARWLGVPVRDVLRLARPRPGADMVLSHSVDGYTASTPLASLTDDGTDATLAVAMNGEPLPLEHGFPVRMVVPGLYGYVSATKWLTELKVTTFAADEAYWTPRGYSARAPIKFSSRIDTPRAGRPVAAGRTAVAGVAWAQTVGIERVEVSIDDGVAARDALRPGHRRHLGPVARRVGGDAGHALPLGAGGEQAGRAADRGARAHRAGRLRRLAAHPRHRHLTHPRRAPGTGRCEDDGMPESPEVQALAEFLDARATGRTIEGSELLEARAMKTRARPLATLSGATIRGVRRFGKHVALALGDPGRGVDGRGVDGRHLVVSFGRAGWATWSEPDAADPPADETRGPGPEVAAIARLDLSGGATLGLTDAGDWLSLGLWVVDDPAEVPAIAKLGPDPLDPAFDRAAFDRVLSGRRKQLKALLAEQESVAGIGNAYSDEILHAARLSPVAHASGLAADARERLVEATVGVLRSAADARRGVPPAGQKAAKVAAMGVHGRTGEACPACADTVRDLPGSAGAQYCPTCQTGGVPL